VGAPLTPRARQIVAVARQLLETEGAQALTMRRLADRLGIRAPSLYKHLPSKAALEVALIAVGFEEAADAFDAATDGAAEPFAALITAYRAFATRHPQLYRLMTEGPLPREQLERGLEDRAAMALVRAAGSPERARAAFAFIHGMVILELNGRFPDDGGLEPAWQAGIAAFNSLRRSAASRDTAPSAGGPAAAPDRVPTP
jgi:AcrR family transcriptional regulator